MQLPLFPPQHPDPDPPTEPPPIEWVTGPTVRRDGLAHYLHLVRSPDDPERVDIRTLPEALRDRVAAWRRSLAKATPESFEEPILALLADGVPRTFNRIAVELLDKTADVLLDTPPDRALWSLVFASKVEHSIAVPVLFRIRRPPPP